MTPKTYRKTATVQALQWTPENRDAMLVWLRDERATWYAIDDSLQIASLEAWVTAYYGDYVCRGVKGEFWRVEQNIFEISYTEISDGAGGKS